MQDSAKFGKLILEYKDTQEQTQKRKNRYMFFTVFFIVAGIIIAALVQGPPIGVGFDPTLTILILIFPLVLAGYNFRKFLLRGKHMEMALYEFGFRYIRGEKIIEIAFSDVKGIQDITWINTQGVSSEHRKIEIIMKDGTEYNFEENITLNHDSFFNELDTVYTDYFVRGITSENINEKNIFFGDGLTLQNGRFIENHKINGQWAGRRTVSLEDVHSLSYPLRPRYHNAMFTLMDASHQVEFIEVELSDVYNIAALRRIIGIAHNKSE